MFSCVCAPKPIEIHSDVIFFANEGSVIKVLDLAKKLQYDLSLVANILFSSRIPDETDSAGKEKLISYLITVLRFTPLDRVNYLIYVFITNNKEKGGILDWCYEQAKKRFYPVAALFSRHSSIDDLWDIQKVYDRKYNSFNLQDTATKDMEYGEKRAAFVKELYKELIQDTEKEMIPSRKEFLELPPSATGKRRAAALLEKIAAFNYSYFDREAKLDLYYRAVRCPESYCSRTPIKGRYAFALPIIKNVFLFSSSNEIYRQTYSDSEGYSLYYTRGKIEYQFNITTFNKQRFNQLDTWQHGLVKLKDSWDLVEDKFEAILAIKLGTPHDPEKLVEFYSNVAELVWLIGNTTPLRRGSGTFAEMMFAIVHLWFDLQIPILRVEFPQLDVLDLSVPLQDYKYIFTYFFEPSTLPETVRITNISPELGVEEQMKKLYIALNKKINFVRDKISAKTLGQFGIIATKPLRLINEYAAALTYEEKNSSDAKKQPTDDAIVIPALTNGF